MIDLWTVEQNFGNVQELHSTQIEPNETSRIVVNNSESDAIVLGSSQLINILNEDLIKRNGIQVTKRKSGGGLVYIKNQKDLWIDIFIPTSSKLSVQDLGESFLWIGQVWLNVLQTLMPNTDFFIKKTKQTRNEISSLICFAGIGHGEIYIKQENLNQKIVGLSQRKTKSGSKIQCLVSGQNQINSLLPYLNEKPQTENFKIKDTELPHNKKILKTFLKALPNPI